MFIIMGLLCLFILLPKEDFSEIENRSLTNLPKFSLSKIVDGSYMEDIEEYINDHFPFRNIFMNIRTISNKFIGKENIGDVYFSNDGYLIEKYDELRNQDRIISVINDFYDNNIDSAYICVKKLMDNESLRYKLGKAGYETMLKKWNAKNAVSNFFTLINSLQHNSVENPIKDGPCSKID